MGQPFKSSWETRPQRKKANHRRWEAGRASTKPAGETLQERLVEFSFSGAIAARPRPAVCWARRNTPAPPSSKRNRVGGHNSRRTVTQTTKVEKGRANKKDKEIERERKRQREISRARGRTSAERPRPNWNPTENTRRKTSKKTKMRSRLPHVSQLRPPRFAKATDSFRSPSVL